MTPPDNSSPEKERDFSSDFPSDPEVSWHPSGTSGPGGAVDSLFVDPFSETMAGPGAVSRPRVQPNEPPVNSLTSAYRLRRVIAEGGQGEVWQAIQVSLNRTVAVKRIRQTVYKGSDQSTARFLETSFYKEALVTGRLDHPAIVPVYDLGSDSEGRPLLAMKLVEGTEWTALIRRSRQGLDPAEFLARHLPILISVCHAVAFAHSRGIIHRDLKPQQVMVGEYGEVYLMDWGLAVVINSAPASATAPTMPDAARGTGIPNPAGTICFMAPEQTEPGGARIGPWTDVFLLGGILYYLLTGTPPWKQEDSRQAFEAAQRESVPPPEERAPGAFLPPELTTLCRSAMARDIGERIGSVEEFRLALEGYLTGANRRQEALRILEEVKTGLAFSSLTYQELSHLDRQLARARALWPENDEAAQLAEKMSRLFSLAAFERGDFALARMQAGRLTDEKERGERLAQIEAEARKLRRLARQRRIAVAACFTLILASAALFSILMRNSARTQAREHALQALQKEREGEAVLAAAEAQEATRRAELFRSLKDLHTTESELSRTFDALWSSEEPVPPLLAHNPYEEEIWRQKNRQKLEQLLQRFKSTQGERARLRSTGLPLGPVPYPLLFGAATTLLYDPTQTRLKEAHDLYAEAVEGRPDRYRAQIGMAQALVRLGDLDCAEEVLVSAARNAGETLGFRGDFGRVLALESEVDRRRWAQFQLPPGAVLIEPRAGGSRFEQFRVVSGDWAESDKPASWAKSSAPGTTPLPGWGSLKLHFFSAFRDVITTMPAVVRYEPRPETSTRYHVYATWPRAANAAPVHYVVRHRGGEADLPLVQNGWGFRSRANSNRWVSLGSYDFDPGTEHGLEIQVQEDVRPFTLIWNGQVQADAVLFSPEPLPEATLAAEVFEPADGIDWLTDFEDASREALRTGRKIFVFAAPPGHPETHHLDAYVFSAPEVRLMLAEKCVPLRVLGSGDTATDWKLRHADNGHVWLCDAEGQAVRRLSLSETLSASALCSAIAQSVGEGGRDGLRN